jgi:Protein of unknown function (DUF3102)
MATRSRAPRVLQAAVKATQAGNAAKRSAPDTRKISKAPILEIFAADPRADFDLRDKSPELLDAAADAGAKRVSPPNSQPPVVSFDYTQINGAVADNARACAARIQTLFRGQQTASIGIGKELLAIKEELGHGNFVRWIEAEFDLTERTAENYMRAAAMFGDKSEIVSVLRSTTLYRLSAKSAPGTVVNVRWSIVSRPANRCAIKIFGSSLSRRDKQKRKRCEKAK